MFKAGDAQLAASFSLKSRSALTIKEVVDEDCLEPPNPEFIHQPILMDLKGGESANPISLHATPLKQLLQPEDNTA
ncbi:hypothetical protein C0995_010168 [Termitomyces sp. Mi166|nr:hypothetical protein C0995_010168 [Termitomyces sp. Mi166\